MVLFGIPTKIMKYLGYRLERDTYPVDFTAFEIQTIQSIRPYTMTPPESVVSLIRAIQYIVSNCVPGDIVECGVWRGGSMMASAMTLLNAKDTSRSLYLYDTFEFFQNINGSTKDSDYKGESGESEIKRINAESMYFVGISEDDVRTALNTTSYPKDKIRYVKGMVEDTIPATIPEKISLLRLDTDLYESTKHELEHLYPRLAVGGVLIIDDYGHWMGAKKAVDEYFSENRIPNYLHRVDYSCRIYIKTA